VAPGQLTQALLDGHPDGTKFVLSGVHRYHGAGLRPRARQEFHAQPGAVVNGSKVLTSWVQDGTRWYAPNQTQRLPKKGGSSYGVAICLPTHPFCDHTEDVFLDGRRLHQIGSLTDLAPGLFFFDYGASRIYIADNPSGHVVETTMGTAAFLDCNTNRFVNLRVEKFGNHAQLPVIRGNGTVLDRCAIQLNHGTGAAIYGGLITRCRVFANGQLGLGGGGTGAIIENNDISWNNAEGHNPYWEGGGTKFAHSTGLIARGNWIHHNRGAGLSLDINNYQWLVEQNTVEQNQHAGVVAEISYDGIVRNNTVRTNGTDRAQFFTARLGVLVINCPNVQVYGNTVEGNTGGAIIGQQNKRLGSQQFPDSDGNTPTRGAWMLQNLQVHSNNIQAGAGADGGFNNGWFMLAGLDVHPELRGVTGLPNFYTGAGNRFSGNTYRVPNTADGWFMWNDGGSGHTNLTWDRWRATGNDSTGTFVQG
jgi:parallel beta-helix repeat protein